MKRNRILAAAATTALAVAALVSVPVSAQAAPSCLFSLGKTQWITEARNDTCALVQARASEYNNYGFVGTYTGAQASGTSTATAPQSGAPGTYVTHSYRYKASGHAWSGWISY